MTVKLITISQTTQQKGRYEMLFNDFIKVYETLANEEVVILSTKNNKGLLTSAIKSGHTLEKFSVMAVTKYKSYESQSTVQYKVENEGKVLTHKLPWGVWNANHKGIIDHKGNHYARFYFFDDKAKASDKVVVCEKPRYYLDGQLVTKDFLDNSGLVTKDFINGSHGDDCLTIDIENIISIG